MHLPGRRWGADAPRAGATDRVQRSATSMGVDVMTLAVCNHKPGTSALAIHRGDGGAPCLPDPAVNVYSFLASMQLDGWMPGDGNGLTCPPEGRPLAATTCSNRWVLARLNADHPDRHRGAGKL